jgi:hypothetical protein
MLMGAILRSCVLVALVSCTVDSPDDSFGMITAGPPMPTAGTPTGDDGDGSSDDDSSGGDDGSGNGSSAGTDAGSTGADDGGTTAGDTGGGAGMQPESGVYSACMTAAQCVGAVFCVPAGDGFCTTECVAPGDCAASPNGAAPTVCTPITMPVTASVCALDCSGGQACPAPMTCTALEGAMVCV